MHLFEHPISRALGSRRLESMVLASSEAEVLHTLFIVVGL